MEPRCDHQKNTVYFLRTSSNKPEHAGNLYLWLKEMLSHWVIEFVSPKSNKTQARAQSSNRVKLQLSSSDPDYGHDSTDTDSTAQAHWKIQWTLS